MKTSKPKSLSNSKKNSSVKKTTRAKPNYVEPLVTDTLKDIIMRQSNTTKKVGKIKIGLHAVSTDSKSTKRLSIKKQNRSHQTGRASTKKQNRVLFNEQLIFEPSKTWNPQKLVNSSQKKQKISLYQQANKSLSRVEQICEQATNSILKTKRKSDASILQQANLMYEMLNKKLNDLQQNQMKFQQNNNARMQKYEKQKNQQLNFLKEEAMTLKGFLDEGKRKNQILQKKYFSLEKNLEFVKYELGNKENIIRQLTQSNKKLRESNFSATSKLPAYQQQIKQLENNLSELTMKRSQLEESILRNQKEKAFIKEQSKFILKNLREYQIQQEIQIPGMTQQSQNENISPKNKI